MLKRIVESRVVLNELAATIYNSGVKKWSIPDLSYNELAQLTDALQPISDFTKQLSSRDSSIASILPIYETLRSSVNPTNLRLDSRSRVQQIIAEELEERMTSMKDSS
jgi:hypothetical protein